MEIHEWDNETSQEKAMKRNQSMFCTLIDKRNDSPIDICNGISPWDNSNENILSIPVVKEKLPIKKCYDKMKVVITKTLKSTNVHNNFSTKYATKELIVPPNINNQVFKFPRHRNASAGLFKMRENFKCVRLKTTATACTMNTINSQSQQSVCNLPENKDVK